MRTRSIGFSIVACSLLFSASACTSGERAHRYYPHAGMETMTMDGKDHRQAVRQVLKTDDRALADDLDLLFMTERPSRLNKWHSK